MARYNNRNSKKYVKSQYLLAILLAVILVVASIGYFIFVYSSNSSDNENNNVVPEQQAQQETQTVMLDEFKAGDFQEIIDDWVNSAGGNSSVVVADSEGEVLASVKPDQIYFAASIYKLYVAYAGYQQVDNGEVDPDENYLNGNTRSECLDLMIRDSDSPCAEKLWNELGKETLTAELETYGIENTSMSAVTTSASDAAILLTRIARGEGLSESSRAAYLDSMKEQDELYRRGLPSGFDSLTVYNKVGWNELVEWHDTAIIDIPDGRQVIVSVCTENVGYRKIAELGKSLETYLLSL
jgi:beta-lactamase class A